jgi:hypothetical protein
MVIIKDSFLQEKKNYRGHRKYPVGTGFNLVYIKQKI